MTRDEIARVVRIELRKQTGLSMESFVEPFGLDSLACLWWLSRRANGEPGLSFHDALADWPDDLVPDDLEVTLDEPDGVDPEV